MGCLRAGGDQRVIPISLRLAALQFFATPFNQERNLAVAASGDAVIAVGGSYGTIAEMALGLRLGRPVIALAGSPVVEGVLSAATPAEAVELALRDLGQTPL